MHVLRHERILILTAWLVTLCLTIIAIAPPAQATNHFHDNPRRHNVRLHSSATGHSDADEDFCVQRRSGAVTTTRVGESVNDALISQTEHWDGAANWKLDFYQTGNNCDYYADKTWIELQYYSYEGPAVDKEKWCSDGYSCVSHFSPVNGPYSAHQDHLYEAIWLEQDHVDVVDGQSRTIVSHETGHVLGFGDPGSTTCPAAEVPSIMHKPYGCSTTSTGPTYKDMDVFVNHIVPAAD